MPAPLRLTVLPLTDPNTRSRHYKIPQLIASTQSGAATASKIIDTQATLKSGREAFLCWPRFIGIHQNSSHPLLNWLCWSEITPQATQLPNLCTARGGGADGFVCRAARRSMFHTFSRSGLCFGIHQNSSHLFLNWLCWSKITLQATSTQTFA